MITIYLIWFWITFPAMILLLVFIALCNYSIKKSEREWLAKNKKELDAKWSRAAGTGNFFDLF
jgi:hypothetical protein